MVLLMSRCHHVTAVNSEQTNRLSRESEIRTIQEKHNVVVTEMKSKIDILKATNDDALREMSDLLGVQEGLLRDNASLENRLKEMKKDKKKLIKSNETSIAKMKRDLEVAYEDMDMVSDKCQKIVGDITKKHV